MKKRRRRIMAIALMSSLFLSGCGTPLYEMTPEEQELITHYSAYVLAKHNKKQTDGLNSRKLTEADWEEDTEALDAQVAEDGLTDRVRNLEEITFGEALGADYKLEVTYKGMSISDSYKEGGYYLLSPDPGYTYAIMNFTIRNGSADPVKVDAFTKSPDFFACFDNSTYRSSETTFLTYSLSTYQGTLQSGETVDVVLLFQIPSNIKKTYIKPNHLMIRIDETEYLIKM